MAYVRIACMGRCARIKLEELLSETRNLGILVRESDVPKYRKQIKDQLRPTQALLDKMVATFLLGRPVGYKMSEVLAEAKKMPDPYANGKRKRLSVAESLKRSPLA